MALTPKIWIEKFKYEDSTKQISALLNIPRAVAQIMINRGLTEIEDCRKFLNPKIEELYSPFLMKDMEKAVQRILVAVEKGEKITVYGDYDVDGVSSTYILCSYLRTIGANVGYYIPNRFDEGYGLNKEAIAAIAKDGTRLIVTVDCGITSVSEVTYAEETGVEVIITDHHQCKDELPNAIAILNPNRQDCLYPFKQLCGAGVALKLCYAIGERTGTVLKIHKYIEIAAIATVADIVPLLGENRIIVSHGLFNIKNTQNIGLKALMRVSGIEAQTINAYAIGFGLGPRINAGGRIDSAKDGVELLFSEAEEKAIVLAEKLDELNRERREIETSIYNEAVSYIEEMNYLEHNKVIIIGGENWHSGVVGIVASRLVEKYYRPCILLCIEGDFAKGSGRSIEGFDLFKALCEANGQIELTKFGGHFHAAGITIEKSKIDAFRKCMNGLADKYLDERAYLKKLYIDFILKDNEIDFKLIDALSLLEPYGNSNEKPLFAIYDTVLQDIRVIGKNKDTLKLRVSKNSRQFDAIGFKMADFADYFSIGQKVDLCFELDKNEWNNNVTIQFIIKDIKPSMYSELKRDYFKSLASYYIGRWKSKKIDMYKKDARQVRSFRELFDIAGNTLILTDRLSLINHVLDMFNSGEVQYNPKNRIFFNRIDGNFLNCVEKGLTILVNPVYPIEYSLFDNIAFNMNMLDDRVEFFDGNLYYLNIEEDSYDISFSLDFSRMLYRYLLKEQKIGIFYNIASLSSKLYNHTGRNEDLFRVMMCLKIFEELELIGYRGENIIVKDAKEKKNIKESSIYKIWESSLNY